MRQRVIFFLVLLLSVLVIAACGNQSKEDVLKDLGNKWGNVNGYELDATMEIKTGSEPRVYDVNVWHTKPDFYRVKVTRQGEDVTQMIVRNKEGVFVVTPSLRKTYKFQSEWPKQNSQPYLIGALGEDLLSDQEVTMEEDENNYIFKAATRNNHKSVMPSQVITVDKKSKLPKTVSVLNEAGEEQILITFGKVDLGTQHKEEEFAIDKFTEENGNTTGSVENQEFQVHYPVLQWQGTTLVHEKKIVEDGVERVILTFEGEKAFTLMEQPIVLDEELTVPVFAPGDPADLGFTIGAITDNSISWEQNGVSFFLATNKLTRDEMIEVASSLVPGSLK